MNLNEVFAVHTAEDGSDMFTHPHTDYICEHLSGSERSELVELIAKGIDFSCLTKSQVVSHILCPPLNLSDDPVFLPPQLILRWLFLF